ncbi:Opacity protein [Pseudomonas cedrina]|uniref:Porin n=2 Tax=Pseudomonas cedrina TaxID=651740 RepID=A0A1V2K9D2_PSECE|nr:outer membrane beta-barrel protein [Pseudomonas cedrina]ONH53686.1 porin [Pseudomonas cedrina subsp. cedrina]SDT52894.1 Opacity protein [Pseudomonas cedrina]
MRKIAYVLLLPAFATFHAQAENWYGSAKFNNARQNLSSSLLTSPRVTGRVDAPDSSKSFVASFAAGYAFDDGWRLEGEYTMPNNSTFKSYWAPFNANVNSLHVHSQRLMLNGYKDIPITSWLSFYAMAGVGVARIEAEGYQTNEARRFASNRQHHLAYSVGMGLEAKVSQQLSLGAGYRYIDMGDVETGYNTFANRVNARDEQLKGKLKEQNVFLEARFSF